MRPSVDMISSARRATSIDCPRTRSRSCRRSSSIQAAIVVWGRTLSPKTVVSPESRALYEKIVGELTALFERHDLVLAAR